MGAAHAGSRRDPSWGWAVPSAPQGSAHAALAVPAHAQRRQAGTVALSPSSGRPAAVARLIDHVALDGGPPPSWRIHGCAAVTRFQAVSPFRRALCRTPVIGLVGERGTSRERRSDRGSGTKGSKRPVPSACVPRLVAGHYLLYQNPIYVSEARSASHWRLLQHLCQSIRPSRCESLPVFTP